MHQRTAAEPAFPLATTRWLVLALFLSIFGAEQSIASPAFERFRSSFFEDEYTARDSLDGAALASLEGAERDRAEEMLLQHLPDGRAVIGLGALRSRRAENALIQLFEVKRDRLDDGLYDAGLVSIARALWRIRPAPRWLEAVVEVLTRSAWSVQRWPAAEALRDFRDPAAVRALVKALDDSDALVRSHSAKALLVIHGLPAEFMDWEHMTVDREHMTIRVMSEDAARREGGKRDILAAIAGRPIAAP
jgi:hypothetical protein